MSVLKELKSGDAPERGVPTGDWPDESDPRSDNFSLSLSLSILEFVVEAIEISLDESR
jgi:hypothetical protein